MNKAQDSQQRQAISDQPMYEAMESVNQDHIIDQPHDDAGHMQMMGGL